MNRPALPLLLAVYFTLSPTSWLGVSNVHANRVTVRQEAAPHRSGLDPDRPKVVPTNDPAKAVGNVYIDVPCTLFDPGKADPQQWMATATIARVTNDGFNYFYGYDPFAQTYDMMVSGFAHSSGAILQETVGVMAAHIPPIITPDNVLGVEARFRVNTTNLFPYELVGITEIALPTPPSSSLNGAQMQSLYEDGRGFSGAVYFLDHLPVGPHAIDLGAEAINHLAQRAGSVGWFGIGFAADGWDLGSSVGELVQWRVDGGGGLPEQNRPFFRIYYNAPPDPAQLSWPTPGELLDDARPTFTWEPTTDPNGDDPIHYEVRVGTDPNLVSAFVLDAATATEVFTPFPLSPGAYYWETVSTDPMGAASTSERRSFLVPVTATSTPPGRNGTPPDVTVFPNPFNPRTVVEWSSDIAGPASAWVVDPRGRRIRTLHSGWADAGPQRVIWDGTDEGGTRVSSGAYLVVVETNAGRALHRATLVR